MLDEINASSALRVDSLKHCVGVLEGTVLSAGENAGGNTRDVALKQEQGKLKSLPKLPHLKDCCLHICRLKHTGAITCSQDSIKRRLLLPPLTP
jgi:hypothetical protein